MRTHIMAVACMAFAAASLASPPNVRDRVEKMHWWDACSAWGKEYRTGKNSAYEAALLDRLERTQLINSLDRGHVGDRSIAIGMTECGVFAARGRPSSLNQTTFAGGRKAQYVYGDRLYVYVDDSPGAPSGIVSAIQN